MRPCQCVARRCGACDGTGLVPDHDARRGFDGFDEWPSYTRSLPARRLCRFCAHGAVFCCTHTKQLARVPDDLDGPELAYLTTDWFQFSDPPRIGLILIQPLYVRARVLLGLALLHKEPAR